MLNPTLTPAQMVADARKDHKALWNRVNSLLPRLRRVQQRTGEPAVPHLEPWTSPRGNTWLLHFSMRNGGPALHTLVWCTDAQQRLVALLVTPTGTSYSLDHAMVQRLGAEHDPLGDPLEHLQGFFLDNHYYTAEVLPEGTDGDRAVRVTMDQGVGVATWDRTADIIHVEQYASYAQLFPGMRAYAGGPDARLVWDTLSLAQQTEHLERVLPTGRTKLRVA